MKVLFDNQIFKAQKYGGISRYFTELFKRFNGKENLEYEMPIRDSDNEYLKKIPPFSNIDLSRKKLLPNINSKLRRVLNKINDTFDKDSNINRVKKALKKQDFDIFHPTYYSSYFLKYLKNKPFVLTVYDMIHEIYPEHFLFDRGMTTRNKKKLVLKADKIIAISENTKKDIIRFYNIKEDKIKVIYLGNSLHPTQGIIKNLPEVPKKYILFVGARGLYKNFTYFIESISPLLKNDKNLNIVAAGGYSKENHFSKKEKNLFKKLGIEKQIIHYSIDDKRLSYLYQNAICFVFPSLYEGFGIPVLEAFACNCPAVISNTSSLPEVGGEAVVYFDPTDSDDILKSTERVIQNETLRAEMISKGKEQLKKFSWEKTARDTMDLYSEIL